MTYRRRQDDYLQDGTMSPGERFRRIEERMDRIEHLQAFLLLVMVADLLVTTGDLIVRLDPVLRALTGFVV